MAQDIGVPGLGAALQELLRLQGRVRPQFDEIIVPTITVADLSHCAMPVVCRSVVTRMDCLKVAGRYPIVRLDAQAGIVCHIKQIWILAEADDTKWGLVFEGMGVTAGSSTVVSKFADGRLRGPTIPGPPTPGVHASAGTSVSVVPTPTWERTAMTGPGIEYAPERWVIGGGQAGQNIINSITMTGFTANQNATVVMEWDEFQSV
jgi:hypothetical protein